MFDKYIKREDALNEIQRFRGYIDEDMEYRMKTAINKIPSADVVPVRRGEWIQITENVEPVAVKCSVCGDISCCRGKYCNECGAMMVKSNGL